MVDSYIFVKLFTKNLMVVYFFLARPGLIVNRAVIFVELFLKNLQRFAIYLKRPGMPCEAHISFLRRFRASLAQSYLMMINSSHSVEMGF